MNQEVQWLLKEKYNGEKTEGFFADLSRLAQGEPLAYIIGHIPFLDTTIYLDSHPLIPRVETEFWVEKAIAEIQTVKNDSLEILDLCAGSGCIGIAVAKHIPHSHVDLVELQNEHLSTINKNIEINGLTPAECTILQGDLYQTEPPLFKRYDFILSNPPYIDPELDRTQDSVANFEPHEALYGGADGLQLIERILTEAPEHLSETGKLFIEHEPEQVKALAAIADSAGLLITKHNDQYEIPRYSTFTVAQ